MPSPQELCTQAQQLLESNPTSVAHRRGAAVIARQAIETATRNALGQHDNTYMTWRSRFLILKAVRPEIDGRPGHLIWEQWSRVCHYQTYDLLPSAASISQKIDETFSWIKTTL